VSARSTRPPSGPLGRKATYLPLGTKADSIFSIDTLNSDVSIVTGVTAENILLFLDDGRQVTLDVLHNTCGRGGEGSASNVSLGFEHCLVK
jgi:hypothetical protein